MLEGMCCHEPGMLCMAYGVSSELIMQSQVVFSPLVLFSSRSFDHNPHATLRVLDLLSNARTPMNENVSSSVMKMHHGCLLLSESFDQNIQS